MPPDLYRKVAAWALTQPQARVMLALPSGESQRFRAGEPIPDAFAQASGGESHTAPAP